MIIAAYAGDDRHLVDYLTAEVLARQPAELRSFLLRTSILTRLSAPLCDAVTERDNSEKILDELERSNLFLIPLDAKREWYRFHPLFAELLQHELARTDRDVLPILHRRASAWYRQADLIVEAASHATAAGDVNDAVELVGRYWPLFLEQGQLATVARWLEALPQAVVAENWLLCVAGLTVAARTNSVDEAARWLEAAERAPQVVRNGERPDAPVGAGRAFLRLWRGDIDGAIVAARHALTAAPSTEPAWAVSSQLILGAALWWSGESTEAKDVLERAARTAQTARLVPETISALGFRAAVALDQGDAVQAEALAREAIELTRRAELEEHPFTSMARIVFGTAHARRGELTEAKGEVQRGIQLAEWGASWLVTAYGLLALAEIHRREREPAAARRLLGRARGMLEALPDPGAGLKRLEQTEKMLRLRATRDAGGASAPFWELSERELTVLRLLAGRLSQREIAAELYLSFNTVKSHTRSIFHKLGVTSRAEAVARAREVGLL
jgi:LuxR family maltose regulon positive regulatory protein